MMRSRIGFVSLFFSKELECVALTLSGPWSTSGAHRSHPAPNLCRVNSIEYARLRAQAPLGNPSTSRCDGHTPPVLVIYQICGHPAVFVYREEWRFYLFWLPSGELQRETTQSKRASLRETLLKYHNLRRG